MGRTPQPSVASSFALIEKLQAESLDAMRSDSDAASRALRHAYSRSRWIRYGLLVTIASLVALVVGSVIMAPNKFPSLKKWYDSNVKGNKPSPGTPPYSISQVVLTSEGSDIVGLMNILGRWEGNLRQNGAIFLMTSIWNLTSRFGGGGTSAPAPSTKAASPFALTYVHWWGSYKDMGKTESDIIGPTGLLCVEPETPGASGRDFGSRLLTFVSKWEASKTWNVWYGAFPTPSTDTASPFAQVPVIQDLCNPAAGLTGQDSSSTNACETSDGQATRLFYLFNGGLCKVAQVFATNDISGPKLYSDYFVGTQKPAPQCGEIARQAAYKGGLSAAMSGVGIMGMMGPAGALAVGALTVGGAVFGGMNASRSAKTTCLKQSRGADLGMTTS